MHLLVKVAAKLHFSRQAIFKKEKSKKVVAKDFAESDRVLIFAVH